MSFTGFRNRLRHHAFFLMNEHNENAIRQFIQNHEQLKGKWSAAV